MVFRHKPPKWHAGISLFLAVLMMLPQSAFSEDRRPESAEERATETPIKHVIVISGENRTFDNIYATYVPKHGTVANLLSKGIVHPDGTPGPNAGLAAQFQLQTINPISYFVDTRKLISPGKTAYSPFLPTPEAGGANQLSGIDKVADRVDGL